MKKLILLILIFGFILNNYGFAEDFDVKVDKSMKKSAEKVAEKKSPAKALLLSAIVPGSGELYLGAKKRAITFMGLAAISWGYYVYTGERVEDFREEYEELAYLYAGLEEPKFDYDEDFYTLLGKYESSEYYKLRIDPSYEGSEWNWKRNALSEKKWYDFKEAKSDESDVKKLQKGVKGGVILLHAISALDAFISTKIHNKNLENVGFDVDWREKDNPTVKLSLKRDF